MLFKTAREIGPGTGIVKSDLFIVPVLISTKFVRSSVPSPIFTNLCLDHSEIAFKACRAQK
jgi:hypothetical protein